MLLSCPAQLASPGPGYLYYRVPVHLPRIRSAPSHLLRRSLQAVCPAARTRLVLDGPWAGRCEVVQPVQLLRVAEHPHRGRPSCLRGRACHPPPGRPRPGMPCLNPQTSGVGRACCRENSRSSCTAVQLSRPPGLHPGPERCCGAKLAHAFARAGQAARCPLSAWFPCPAGAGLGAHGSAGAMTAGRFLCLAGKRDLRAGRRRCLGYLPAAAPSGACCRLIYTTESADLPAGSMELCYRGPRRAPAWPVVSCSPRFVRTPRIPSPVVSQFSTFAPACRSGSVSLRSGVLQRMSTGPGGVPVGLAMRRTVVVNRQGCFNAVLCGAGHLRSPGPCVVLCAVVLSRRPGEAARTARSVRIW
jgi:hypothetical protein